MQETNDLLLEMQQILNCVFLSDLPGHYKLLNNNERKKLMKIPVKRYSVEAWNQAIEYILNEKCCFSSVEEAMEKIINYS